ncbi:lung adenoma susceptibility protein 2 [Bufo gargarizans]|uniref:lung adenoma susceptibility protein 2 n=1 Tax=Bufo gargarizans TaxID=30331 RepID=UPI001CF1C204|nr:lung adenoma susceptibility protein 2 [Bufo gargarizans]
MATSSSPDSSVSISSLLASCSLRSSNHSDGVRPAATIQYKDRLYDSASKALEDYIMDYEAASTGQITVRPSTTLTSPTRRARPSVRRTRPLTRSRYVARDPDLLSLTTDDLLGFPPDGSLPFSQASERKRRKNLKTQYGFSPQVTSVTSPLTHSSLRGTALSTLDLRDHRLRSQDFQRLKETTQRDHSWRETERENDSGLYNNVTSVLYKSYPRWLTSQKSELGVSGITSIPEVRYPVWLRDHRLLDDVDNHLTGALHRDGPGSSLDHLQIPRYDLRGYKAVNSSSFRDSMKPPARSDLDIVQHLHTPGKNRPVQKSEQTGDVTRQDLSQEPPCYNQSPRTEDILEVERSWEKVPYSYKSPVHVLCEDEESKGLKAFKSNLVEDFLKDCVQQEKAANTFSGGNHHGPVEALKHILFNMQAFQQNFNQETSTEHLKEFQKISTEAETEIQKADQEIFPVNKSLQKALHHLSRLKELVGDCNLKKQEDHRTDVPT